MPVLTHNAAETYATKGNIVYPGDADAAAAAETDALESLTDLFGDDNGTYATLTTAMTGTNNDLVLLARTPGTGGNSITLTIVDPAGNNAALSVDVSTNAITVNGATNGSSALTSTASEVIAAINADAEASALVVAELAPSNTGAGVVTALSATALSGGSATNPSLDTVSATLSILPDLSA